MCFSSFPSTGRRGFCSLVFAGAACAVFPPPAWGEEYPVRLFNDPDPLATTLARSDWFDRLANIARKAKEGIKEKLSFIFYDAHDQKQTLSLSYAKDESGGLHPVLTGPDGESAQLRLSGHKESGLLQFFRYTIALTDEHGTPITRHGKKQEYPLHISEGKNLVHTVIGLLGILVLAWIGVMVGFFLLRAFAYILWCALLIGLALAGIGASLLAAHYILGRMGIHVAQLDQIKALFERGADQLKAYLQGKLLDWHSKKS